MAVQWLACGPPPQCHHSMQHVGHMRNVGKTRVRIKIFIMASFGLFGWLTYGLPMACLWPKLCKQERTAQVPSFFTVCGLEQGVGSGRYVGQIKVSGVGLNWASGILLSGHGLILSGYKESYDNNLILNF